MQLGQVVSETDAAGGVIRKVVSRIAYPRNGNCGNATVTYRWEFWRDGRLVLQSPLRRELLAEIQ